MILKNGTSSTTTFAATEVNRKKPAKEAAATLGRIGGAAGIGAAKARTSEQARAAVMVRWERHWARREAAKTGGPISL